MKQIARNLTDPFDGFLLGKQYLIMDRDKKFTDAFRKFLEDEGVESVRLPPRSPNLNPHLERFMRSVKEEALERMIFFGEKMLRAAVGQFLKATQWQQDALNFVKRQAGQEARVKVLEENMACFIRQQNVLRPWAPDDPYLAPIAKRVYGLKPHHCGVCASVEPSQN